MSFASSFILLTKYENGQKEKKLDDGLKIHIHGRLFF